MVDEVSNSVSNRNVFVRIFISRFALALRQIGILVLAVFLTFSKNEKKKQLVK